MFIKFNNILKYQSKFQTRITDPQTMRIQFIRRSSMIAIFPLVIYALYNIMTGNVLFSITTGSTIVFLLAVNFLLLRTKYINRVIGFILVLVYIMATISIFFGQVQYYSLIWMVCTLTITYYLIGSKKGLKLNIVFLLFLFVILFIRLPQPISYSSIVNIMFGLAFLSVTLYSYERSRELYQIDLEEKQLELERVSNTDSLTGLYNRKRIERTIGEELSKLVATELSMPDQICLLLIDIDHFKRINDTYGHQEGDKAIKEVSRIILHNMRNYGAVARWGGEEFLVFTHDVPTSKIIELAESTRVCIEQAEFENGMKITASMGINFYSKGDTYDSLLKRADDCLYKAKEQGRNRVEVSLI